MNDLKDSIYYDSSGEVGNGASECVVQQVFEAINNSPCLTENLMEKIASIANLKRAFRAVKRNKGSAGIDNVSIEEVKNDIEHILPKIREELLNANYLPVAIKAVKIPKSDGKSFRQLGIPTVMDRIVSQAIAQILSPLFERDFSEFSYGFRPNRNAKQAIEIASQYVGEGNNWVVDIDLENFFDNVNHDILMAKIARKIPDKRVLKIIRRFLNAEIMQNGVCRERDEGTPQGSPLSPLLSNIMLDELDKELEKRGHKFCRYADDCNIYVASKMAGKRVLKSLENFINKRLKLKVNKTKSAVDKVKHRKFLGFRLQNNGDITIAPQSLKNIRKKIRMITKRNRGISLNQAIFELNRVLRGWFHYFKIAKSSNITKMLDGWIRRRLRCFRIKQLKRKYTLKVFLAGRGISQLNSWNLACSKKGLWRKSFNPIVHKALGVQYFKWLRLFSLHENYQLFISSKPPCATAHAGWCERVES